VILIIAVPAESILLRALTTPSTADAARAWVSGLSDASLHDAADRVQSYSFAYRKEILRALAPAERAEVWRGHLQGYLDAHPELDQMAVIAIKAAIMLATPEAFGAEATDALKAQVGIVAQQLSELLGRDEALYLMYRLGPKDGSFASVEPVTEKLANYIRHLAVVMAGDGGDCDCSTGFGCDGSDNRCFGATGCTADTEWPACGWFWNEDCDGTCQAGAEA
jgi:hypothetical protein